MWLGSRKVDAMSPTPLLSPLLALSPPPATLQQNPRGGRPAPSPRLPAAGGWASLGSWPHPCSPCPLGPMAIPPVCLPSSGKDTCQWVEAPPNPEYPHLQWTTYICRDPISKRGHILRLWVARLWGTPVSAADQRFYGDGGL